MLLCVMLGYHAADASRCQQEMPLASENRTGRRVGVALLWLVTLLEVAGMGVAGWSKFGSPEAWTGMFESWGYPAWFAFVIGGSEMFTEMEYG